MFGKLLAGAVLLVFVVVVVVVVVVGAVGIGKGVAKSE